MKGKPEERAINFALLRTMKQAEYSQDDFRHYALNEDHYCHFTSPIRRYPDLTIHRIVGELARGKKPKLAGMSELVQLGKNCSTTERRAEKAERELKRIKLLRYLEDKVGDEIDAFITGVESFGIFCQGIKVPAEGLVHISSLTDDFYTYNQSARTLSGDRSGTEYRLGDAIRVMIANVDVDRRQLDLRIVGSPGAAANKTSKRRKSAGKKPSRKTPGGRNSTSAERKPSGAKKKKNSQRRKRR